MKNKLRSAVKFTTFVLIACICVYIVNAWMMPKYFYNQEWPATNTYKDFYSLDRNSVDVLFLGSSHAASAFNPQIIYESYGITSYNLGCEQQSLLVTYYWLEEALKYQSPKAVVLDTYTFFRYEDSFVYNDTNCAETALRKPMDSMRLSPLKVQAAIDIEKLDSAQSAMSYILTNIRYHTRWADLIEEDYSAKSMTDHGGVKGYALLGGIPGSGAMETFREAEADWASAEPFAKVADIYLDKIVDLCEDNGIQLIFECIPYGEPVEKYKATNEYADSRGIPFYDMNEETLYQSIGYDAEIYGYGHPNYKGAECLSLFIGNLLQNEYGIPAREDASFIRSGEIYRHKVRNIELAETMDIHQYLKKIRDDDYCVFIMATNSFGANIDDEMMTDLQNIGIQADLRGQKEGCFFAVIENDGVTEKLSFDDVALSGSIDDGSIIYNYTIDTSVALHNYHVYSLVIDGIECANRKPGLNMIIYDYDEKQFVDRVNVDTSVENLTMTRY